MPGADDIQRVAAALESPRAGYLKHLKETQRVIADEAVEAARQLEVFIERVGDLTAEELQELHVETFRGESPAVRRTVARLAGARTAGAAAGAVLGSLEPLLDRLEAERNPFAYVVRALCCLLLRRVASSGLEPSS
jgi:nitrate reductase assembly molybdenum cofactor insertion protein NarJ